MASKKQSTSNEDDKNGRVKVGKVRRDQEPVTELTASEQRQIHGGAPQTKPVSASVPRPGGGGCDDWGCGSNHNETLVRDTALIETR